MLTQQFFVMLASHLKGASAGSSDLYIAVGGGDPAWDRNPPLLQRGITRLANELARKSVAREDVRFLDEAGVNTEMPSPRLRLRLRFEGGEATGTLREVGLFANASGARNSGTLLSYFVHAPIDSATATRAKCMMWRTERRTASWTRFASIGASSSARRNRRSSWGMTAAPFALDGRSPSADSRADTLRRVSGRLDPRGESKAMRQQLSQAHQGLRSTTPPAPGHPAPVARAKGPPHLQLHRSLGNQGLQRLLQARAVQARLHISQPNDPYEQEADRVADQVMRMPATEERRAAPCAACVGGRSTCPTCAAKNPLIQRRVSAPDPANLDAPAPDGLLQALGRGQPLDSQTRAFMERRFGHDCGRCGVR